MARTYTPHPLKNNQTIRADKLRKLGYDLQAGAESLEGYQIPPEVGDTSNMQPINVVAGPARQTLIESAFSTWHSWFESGPNVKIVYPNHQDASTQWTTLTYTFYEPSLEFEAGPGSAIHGCLCIDSELRCSTNIVTQNVIYDSNSTPWREFGVFVNGRLVATTGRLWNGRDTIDLPFLAPVAGGPVTVQIKYRVYPGFLDDPGDSGAPTLNIRPLIVNTFHLWARRPKQ